MTIVRRDDVLPHPIDIKFEITPFREESGYADNRHPDSIVRSSNLLSDAGRRDFTINAMYYEKLKGEKAKRQKEEGNKITALEAVDSFPHHNDDFLDNDILLKELKDK